MNAEKKMSLTLPPGPKSIKSFQPVVESILINEWTAFGGNGQSKHLDRETENFKQHSNREQNYKLLIW